MCNKQECVKELARLLLEQKDPCYKGNPHCEFMHCEENLCHQFVHALDSENCDLCEKVLCKKCVINVDKEIYCSSCHIKKKNLNLKATYCGWFE